MYVAIGALIFSFFAHRRRPRSIYVLETASPTLIQDTVPLESALLKINAFKRAGGMFSSYEYTAHPVHTLSYVLVFYRLPRWCFHFAEWSSCVISFR